MPLWFSFALLSFTFLAASELIQKHVMSDASDVSAETNNFIVWSIQGSLALVYLLIFIPTFELFLTPSLLLQLALLGSIYFFAGTLYYTSFKHGSASISIVVASISIVVTTVLGILLFSESSSLVKFFGIALIIGAIAALRTKGSTISSKQLTPALLGGALYGVAYTLDKYFSIQLNPHMYQIFFAWSVALASLTYRGKKIYSERNKLHKKIVTSMLVAGFLFFCFNKLTFMAYALQGEVGKIDAINNASIFLVLLVEIIIFKETDNILKKLLTATIAFIGVVLLGLY
ncbi:EamA family transporter [candidate division WWE3 bacterium]|uniref:EamA family transporter n=1 Tax=candidate division WWE3 bacterium TaxID=2053526 RepID=A0A955LVP8_UNCKA|nr:EamA family transporter [candidate division WWE3 bacterium]